MSESFGGVPFDVVVAARWDDWVAVPTLVTRRVPGGNVSITEFLGMGPERVSYPLMLASAATFASLKLLIGTSGTLILELGSAALAGSTTVDGHQHVAGVILVGIDPGSVRREGAVVFCTATFQRNIPA